MENQEHSVDPLVDLPPKVRFMELLAASHCYVVVISATKFPFEHSSRSSKGQRIMNAAEAVMPRREETTAKMFKLILVTVRYVV